MNSMLRNLAVYVILLLPAALQGQTGKKVIPYPYVREADVLWKKDVWEVIDLREKFNQDLYYPMSTLKDRESLFQIIRDGVLPGDGVPPLVAYSSMDDEFKARLSTKELKSILSRTDTVYGPDINDPNQYVNTVIHQDIGPADIKQYWIQEEWFFDKQRSVLDVRIIGIMPVIEKKNDKGEAEGMAATFWISFEELRPLLVKYYAFNRKNDAQRLTYDDLFIKRMFSAYIIKEDNTADRMIADYKGAHTLDALLESENIRNGIRMKESDMWNH